MSEGQESRARIMAAVRDALGARGDEPGRRGSVDARLERSPDGLIPARARRPKPELIDQLATMLRAQGATVRIAETLAELPRLIADQLADYNLPARLRHGSDPVITGLDWTGTMIERDLGPADPADAVSLSRAMAAAAETGTLILTSGPDNPSTLNFLPETHFIILLAEHLRGSYEEAWAMLRAAYGPGCLPRTVNFISGASATADIEQTLIRGAHGPRRLAVFVVTAPVTPS